MLILIYFFLQVDLPNIIWWLWWFTQKKFIHLQTLSFNRRIQFNLFKWYEVSMSLLRFLSLWPTFNVLYILSCPWRPSSLLTPVWNCHVTLFNYVGKKEKDVGLTCRCHLSNIMPYNIFYDSIGWGWLGSQWNIFSLLIYLTSFLF